MPTYKLTAVQWAADVFARAASAHHIIGENDHVMVERGQASAGIPYSLYIVHRDPAWPKDKPIMDRSKIDGISLDDCFYAEAAYMRLTSAALALDAATRAQKLQDFRDTHDGLTPDDIAHVEGTS